MKKRIIITGAGGFLGCNVVESILADQVFDKVYAVTLGSEQMKLRFQESEMLSIYEADAITTGSIPLDAEDLVLNCVYPRAMKGKDITFGIDYIESVFQIAAKASVKGIVNISSQSVYDPQRDRPATEQDIPCLTDEYSIGKYCIELLLNNICKMVPHTNIRLASLIGPGFDQRVVNRLVDIALRDHVLRVQLNRQQFGYLDVADAARGLKKLMQVDPSKWETVYNLGPKQAITLHEMAYYIKDILLKDFDINIVIESVNGNEIQNTALDSNLLVSTIGEFRFLSAQESIRRIIRAKIGYEKQK